MVSLLILFACGDGSKSADDSGFTAQENLTLLSVMPSQVVAAGGDRVVLEGTGFDTSSVVAVNGTPCESTFLESATEMACVTPASTPGEGTISIVRESDGAADELPLLVVGDETPGDGQGGDDQGDDDGAGPGDTGTQGGSDTDGSASGDAVEYCHVQYPCTLSLPAGGSTVDLDRVYTWVYAEGVTQGVGAGVGLEVSLGVGATDADPATDWTWSDCEYNGDRPGLDSEDANDEFMGDLVAPEEAGTYSYGSRVRIADGPWLYCDLGPECPGGLGSNDGFSTATAGVLTVTAR